MRYKHYLRRFLQCYFWCIAISLILLLFVSWVLGIYVDGVSGLLTARGIRWLCINIVPNFASVHLAKMLLGLMAISVLRESGIISTYRRHVSLKQKRALQITGVSFLLIVCLFSLLLFLPNAPLLSAFGTFQGSALSKGFYGIFMCLAIFIGNVYGYTSGRFLTMRDFVHAHVSIFSTVANYFVILFLASQLVGCLDYTGILPLLGADATVLYILRGILYNVPLLLYILLAL
ncbi:MAG: AbgT family transporter [Bacteroidaceae bacterium]|nr:AbgT family transporter [Bacteroidaceae bacterium]